MFKRFTNWLKKQPWAVVIVLALYSLLVTVKMTVWSRVGLFVFLLIILLVVRHIKEYKLPPPPVV